MPNGRVSHTPPDGPCVVSPTVNPWVVSVLTVITLIITITAVLLIVYAKGMGEHVMNR